MIGRTYKIKQGQIDDYETLLKIIKGLRSELIRFGGARELTDPELLSLSRRLDLMINRFMRCSLVKPR